MALVESSHESIAAVFHQASTAESTDPLATLTAGAVLPIQQRRCAIREAVSQTSERLMGQIDECLDNARLLDVADAVQLLVSTLSVQVKQSFDDILSRLPPIDPAEGWNREEYFVRVVQLREESRIHRLRISRHRKQFDALAEAYRRMRKFNHSVRHNLYAGLCAIVEDMKARGMNPSSVIQRFSTDWPDPGGKLSDDELHKLLTLEDNTAGLDLFSEDEVQVRVAEAVNQARAEEEERFRELERHLLSEKGAVTARIDEAVAEATAKLQKETKMFGFLKSEYEQKIDELQGLVDAADRDTARRLEHARQIRELHVSGISKTLETAQNDVGKLKEYAKTLEENLARTTESEDRLQGELLEMRLNHQRELHAQYQATAALRQQLAKIPPKEVIAAEATKPYIVQVDSLKRDIAHKESLAIQLQKRLTTYQTANEVQEKELNTLMTKIEDMASTRAAVEAKVFEKEASIQRLEGDLLVATENGKQLEAVRAKCNWQAQQLTEMKNHIVAGAPPGSSVSFPGLSAITTMEEGVGDTVSSRSTASAGTGTAKRRGSKKGGGLTFQRKQSAPNPQMRRVSVPDPNSSSPIGSPAGSSRNRRKSAAPTFLRKATLVSSGTQCNDPQLIAPLMRWVRAATTRTTAIQCGGGLLSDGELVSLSPPPEMNTQADGVIEATGPADLAARSSLPDSSEHRDWQEHLKNVLGFGGTDGRGSSVSRPVSQQQQSDSPARDQLLNQMNAGTDSPSSPWRSVLGGSPARQDGEGDPTGAADRAGRHGGGGGGMTATDQDELFSMMAALQEQHRNRIAQDRMDLAAASTGGAPSASTPPKTSGSDANTGNRGTSPALGAGIGRLPSPPPGTDPSEWAALLKNVLGQRLGRKATATTLRHVEVQTSFFEDPTEDQPKTGAAATSAAASSGSPRGGVARSHRGQQEHHKALMDRNLRHAVAAVLAGIANCTECELCPLHEELLCRSERVQALLGELVAPGPEDSLRGFDDAGMGKGLIVDTVMPRHGTNKTPSRPSSSRPATHGRPNPAAKPLPDGFVTPSRPSAMSKLGTDGRTPASIEKSHSVASKFLALVPEDYGSGDAIVKQQQLLMEITKETILHKSPRDIDGSPRYPRRPGAPVSVVEWQTRRQDQASLW